MLKKLIPDHDDSGFTLIELLVVIVIIGILASIAVIGVSAARNSANVSQCNANATQVVKALVEYELSNGAISATPTTTSLTGTIAAASLTTSVTGVASTAGLGPGVVLTKTSGTGAFGGATSVTSVESSTAFNITSTATNTVGSLTFSFPITNYTSTDIAKLWTGVTYIANEIPNFSSTAGLAYYLRASRLANGAYKVAGYSDTNSANPISGCTAFSG